jgi:putative hydrolase of the HAD superfamily
VLFDMYGTLLLHRKARGHSPARARAIARLLLRRKVKITPPRLAELLDTAIRSAQARMRATGIDYPEVRIEAIWRGIVTHSLTEDLRELIVEYELANSPAWPMPGARRLLAALARQGVVLGIVSNAQFYTPLFFDALFGRSLEAAGFSPDLCLYSFQHGEAKPSQRLFGLIANRLRARGIRKREVLFIGNDPLNDMVPAARCGFMTALAAIDRRTLGEHRAVRGGADLLIGSFADVEPLVLGANAPRLMQST